MCVLSIHMHISTERPLTIRVMFEYFEIVNILYCFPDSLCQKRIQISFVLNFNDLREIQNIFILRPKPFKINFENRFTVASCFLFKLQPTRILFVS